MEIICPNPNCGYKGEPKKVKRGSVLIGIFLLAFYIIPGVLYFLFYYEDRYYCPKCGNEIKIITENGERKISKQLLILSGIVLLILVISIITLLIAPVF